MLGMHGITAQKRIQTYHKCIGAKVAERLEAAAPSLAMPKKLPQDTSNNSGKTPLKDNDPPIKVHQTRSAVKNSLQKTAPQVVKGVPQYASIFQKSSRARKSLATLCEVNSPKNAHSPHLNEPIPQRETPRKLEENQKDKAMDPQKEELIDLDDSVESVEAPKIKKRFNTWYLDHESSREAWLDDATVHWYISFMCRESKKYAALDPILWSMYKIKGPEYIMEELQDAITYFFPICEGDHWVLLILSGKYYYFANSFHQEPRGAIKTFINETGKIWKEFNTPVPFQRDSYNCGIHVCLAVNAIMAGSKWHTEEDVEKFRGRMKKTLLEEGYELYSVRNLGVPFQAVVVDKMDYKEATAKRSYAKVLATPSPPAKRPDCKSDVKLTQRKEYDGISEAVKPEVSTISPKDMDRQKDIKRASPRKTNSVGKLSPNGFVKVSQIAHPVPLMKYKNPVYTKPPPKYQLSRTPLVTNGKKKEKQRQVPSGKPDVLKSKVRGWLQIQLDSYEKEGGTFQRLEWLAGLLTAAIHKAAAGDETMVDTICKRYPPLEVKAGEMCTQTDPKKRGNHKHPQNGNQAKILPAQELQRTNTGSENCTGWMERARTLNKIVGTVDKKCRIPIEELENFFKKTTSHTNVPIKTLKESCSMIPQLKIGQEIVEPFTGKEVVDALERTKDTAPGADGLRYHHLAWFDPDGQLLKIVFNECQKHRKIPSHWKEAETILLYKNGDEAKAENWRPISKMPTIYKLYSSLWNRRIRKVPDVLSKCQRGFQEREGCNESLGILRSAIDIAEGKKKNLAVAWLDLTNAFGSVPHEPIEHTLKAYGFPPMIVDIIKDMYKGASMIVKNSTEGSILQVRQDTNVSTPTSKYWLSRMIWPSFPQLRKDSKVS